MTVYELDIKRIELEVVYMAQFWEYPYVPSLLLGIFASHSEAQLACEHYHKSRKRGKRRLLWINRDDDSKAEVGRDFYDITTIEVNKEQFVR